MSAYVRRARYFAPELLVGIATVVTLGLGLYQIDRRSFWLDEATTHLVSGVSWLRLLEIFLGAEHGWHPPTYFVVLKAWRAIFGDGEAALRGLSVLFAALMAPVTYLLVRDLMSRWPAAIAALFMAFNAYVIRYAQEARTYSMTMFLAVLGTWLLVRALRSGSRRLWALYAVVAILGVYSQLFFGLVVAAHAATVILQRDRPALVGPVLGFGLVALVTSPLVIGSLFGSGALLSWVPPMRWDAFRQLAVQLSGGNGASLVAYGCGVFLAVAWATIGPGRGWRWTPMLVLWLVVPAAVLAVLSIVKPVFLVRYLAISLPALVILVAIGITRLPRWAAGSLALLILITSTFGIADWYATEHREWRAIARHLASEGSAEDGVVLRGASIRKPLAYQMAALESVDLPSLVNPPRPWNWNPYARGDGARTRASESLESCSFDHLWLVGGPMRLDRWNRHLPLEVIEPAYDYVDSQRFGDMRVHRFRRNSTECPAAR